MNVIPHSRLAQASLPGIEHVTLAGSAQGLKRLSVWRQRIDAGGATPPHRHDCEEVVLVHAGRGELHLEGQVQSFGPDTTLVVPADAVHRIVSTGPEPLELTGIFSVAPVPVCLPDGQPLELPWDS